MLRSFARFNCLAALLTVGGLNTFAAEVSDQPDLAALFRSPLREAKAQTFWHWMNGNVTRDGITRDLEAMQRVGIGGVMIFDGSTYLPAGPAGYLGETWRELMTHAFREGERLGLEVGMHNAPGWSSSGGPWVQPEKAMQQLVWTETTLRGGQRVQADLPQPHVNLGFYRDAYVVAFPAPPGEQVPYADIVAQISSGGRTVDPRLWCDGRMDTAIAVEQAQPIVIKLREPTTLHGLTARASVAGSLPGLRVEVSSDGEAFEELTTISAAGSHGIVAPSIRTFAPVEARVVRLVPRRDGAVGELVLHRSPRIADWAAKANFDYRSGGQIRIPQPGASVAAIDPATVVDLTNRVEDGRLTWEAPAGVWIVLRLGYTPTGKKNVAASAAGSGLEIDKFDPTATEFHFNHVIQRILADAAAAGVKGPRNLILDSYEVGMQNWTRNFPAEFRERTGYELLPYVPTLVGRVVGDPGRSERFLFDFRTVQADLVAEHYYGKMGQLAEAHGLRYYVEGYGPGPFDELRISGSAEVPTTEFWTRTPWTPNRTVKMVTSAAHVYGKPVVAAEAFTGEAETSRWLEYPYALKALGDEMFAAGLNQLLFHRYAHQPHPTAVPGMTMGPWGSHFDRTNTWFEQSGGWLEYLNRAQTLLRQGTYAADVLYFTGERPPDSSQYAIPVLPTGYTYDLINAEVLLHRLQVQDGEYVLPEGGRYQVLALPSTLQGMTPELLERLETFAAAGAMIVGPRPQFSPTLRGYPGSEAEMLRRAEVMWQRRNVRPDLTIGEALRVKQVAPDFRIEAAAPDVSLAWQHRRVGDQDLYFIANRQRRSEHVVLSFRGMAGRQPEVWRPESATMVTAPIFRNAANRLELPLWLEPAEGVFVCFRRGDATPAATRLSWNRQAVVGAEAIPAPAPDSANNFTMAIWVKPDTNLRVLPKESTTGRIDEVGKYYAIAAGPGDLRFGEGHATAGLAVGRNGVYVVERSSEAAPAVLVAKHPISGWTHVAVVYRDGQPELYLNGGFVKRGLKSGRTVHSGVGAPPPPVDYTLHFAGIEAITRAAGEKPPPSRGQVFVFEGNFAPATSVARALTSEEIMALVAQGVPEPVPPLVTDLHRPSGDTVTFAAWRSGTYELVGDGGVRSTLRIDVPEVKRLDGAWQVEFPPERGAPTSIVLPELRSLHEHPDPGVRHFSGTATYHHEWIIDSPAPDGQRLVLDLGRVEVVASVKVNGQPAGTVWKEPYRLDITPLAQPGKNRLEVSVSTLWTNRLIGDEHLPAEDEFGLHDERGVDPFGIARLPEWYRRGEPKPPGGRVTFATWRFYTPDEPLVASGLLGPVFIRPVANVTMQLPK